MSNSKVATLVGKAGMTSDDGRALTYGWDLYLNRNSGLGFYDSPLYFRGLNGEEEAIKYCEENGYTITSKAVT